MDAAIVEFDPLADPVGTAAQDDDLGAVGGVGFAQGRTVTALERRVHVGCLGCELGRAGVDTLVNRDHAERVARGGDGGLSCFSDLGEPLVRETQGFQPTQCACFCWQAGYS